jgi:hypothetical protein
VQNRRPGRSTATVVLPYTCPSIIHTIPLPAPFEEIEGDDPGNEKLVAVGEAAAALNVLDAGTNVYALPVAPEPK